MIHYNINQTSAPAVEPVSTSEMKSHSRIDISTDDTLLGTYIKAATQRFEIESRRALITQTWVLRLDRFPTSGSEPILLPRPPVQSVTSVAYIDGDGDSQTWDSSKYVLDSTSEPGRIYPAYGESWPSTRDIENAVTITYVAGYGDASTDVPQDIIQAIEMLAAHWYEHRESVSMGTIVTNVPQSWDFLVAPHRVFYDAPC